VHERSHSGEKPFGCRYCDYRAARASDITVHERSHSGEKPFGCRYCDYRAAVASDITVHAYGFACRKPAKVTVDQSVDHLVGILARCRVE
jgi:hypothetical protein